MKKLIFIFVAILLVSYFLRDKQQPKVNQEISIIHDPGSSNTTVWYSDPLTGEKVDLPSGKFYEPGITNIKEGWRIYLSLPKFLGYILFNLFFCYIFARGLTQRLLSKTYYPLGAFIPIWIFDFIVRISILLGNKLIDSQNNSENE